MNDLEQTVATLVQRMRSKPNAFHAQDAMKVSLVMPFLAALGYDVFDPDQVAAGHQVDDNRVDFATYGDDGNQQMLVSVTSNPSDLDSDIGRHLNNALAADGRVGLLTNGDVYRFHMVEEGVLERQPFLSISLLAGIADLTPLVHLGHHGFDPEASRLASHTLLLPAAAYAALLDELTRDESETLDLLADRISPDHHGNDAARDAVRAAMARAIRVLRGEETIARPTEQALVADDTEENRNMSGDEQAAYEAVHEICSRYLDGGRVHPRMAQAYSSVLLDDNNRKYVCRLYFSASSTRYIGTFVGREETKHRIYSYADVENFVEQIESRLRELDPGTFVKYDAERRVKALEIETAQNAERPRDDRAEDPAVVPAQYEPPVSTAVDAIVESLVDAAGRGEQAALRTDEDDDGFGVTRFNDDEAAPADRPVSETAPTPGPLVGTEGVEVASDAQPTDVYDSASRPQG